VKLENHHGVLKGSISNLENGTRVLHCLIHKEREHFITLSIIFFNKKGRERKTSKAA